MSGKHVADDGYIELEPALQISPSPLLKMALLLQGALGPITRPCQGYFSQQTYLRTLPSLPCKKRRATALPQSFAILPFNILFCIGFPPTFFLFYFSFHVFCGFFFFQVFLQHTFNPFLYIHADKLPYIHTYTPTSSQMLFGCIPVRAMINCLGFFFGWLVSLQFFCIICEQYYLKCIAASGKMVQRGTENFSEICLID